MGNREDIYYGDYIDIHNQVTPLSKLYIHVLPLDMIVQWRRCGQTADYVARFLAYHFSGVGRSMNLLSTILNELLENCVKFSFDKRHPIDITALLLPEKMILQATNSISFSQEKVFAAFIDTLFREDLDELFITQIMRSAENQRDDSGLGLITLKRDYVSTMGVRIQPLPNVEFREVSVQLQLDPDDIGDG